MAAELPGADFRTLLDSFNDRWVTAASFFSPRVLIDLLAATDFSAGAMENPGLIVFRAPLLLLDAKSPIALHRDSFTVNAHELAHQWFGDTVTMPWWDDVWLNEAFASWMADKITQQLRPQYRAELKRA